MHKPDDLSTESILTLVDNVLPRYYALGGRTDYLTWEAFTSAHPKHAAGWEATVHHAILKALPDISNAILRDQEIYFTDCEITRAAKVLYEGKPNPKMIGLDLKYDNLSPEMQNRIKVEAEYILTWVAIDLKGSHSHDNTRSAQPSAPERRP